MNKKFLSAILFGALMVTSTGTFVSCKDYDDDIENLQGQIDKNSSAIAELQKLVGAGNWVTSISPVTGGFTVTMSNGQSQTITGINGADGKDGKNGTEWTIGEDGFWYMDGEKTDNVAIGKNGENGVTAPSPSIGADGNWVVYNWDAEKGEFVAEATEIPAQGTAAYAVEANGVITLHIADANGEYMEVVLPTTCDSFIATSPAAIVNVLHQQTKWTKVSGKDNKALFAKLAAEFPEIEEYEKDQLMKQGGNLPVIISPANVELTNDYKYTLQNVKGEVSKAVISNPVKGMPETELVVNGLGMITRSADSNDCLWTLNVEPAKNKKGTGYVNVDEAHTLVIENEKGTVVKTAFAYYVTSENVGDVVVTYNATAKKLPFADEIDVLAKAYDLDAVDGKDAIFTIKNGMNGKYILEVDKLDAERYDITVDGSKLLIGNIPSDKSSITIGLNLIALGLNGSVDESKTDAGMVKLTVGQEIAATGTLEHDPIVLNGTKAKNKVRYNIEDLGLSAVQLNEFMTATTKKLYISYVDDNDQVVHVEGTRNAQGELTEKGTEIAVYKANGTTAASSYEDAAIFGIELDPKYYEPRDYDVRLEVVKGGSTIYVAEGTLTIENPTTTAIKLAAAFVDENGVLQITGNPLDALNPTMITYELKNAFVYKASEVGNLKFEDMDSDDDKNWIPTGDQILKIYKWSYTDTEKQDLYKERNFKVTYNLFGNVNNKCEMEFKAQVVSEIYSADPSEVITLTEARLTTAFGAVNKPVASGTDEIDESIIDFTQITKAVYAAGLNTGKEYKLWGTTGSNATTKPATVIDYSNYNVSDGYVLDASGLPIEIAKADLGKFGMSAQAYMLLDEDDKFYLTAADKIYTIKEAVYETQQQQTGEDTDGNPVYTNIQVMVEPAVEALLMGWQNIVNTIIPTYYDYDEYASFGYINETIDEDDLAEYVVTAKGLFDTYKESIKFGTKSITQTVDKVDPTYAADGKVTSVVFGFVNGKEDAEKYVASTINADGTLSGTSLKAQSVAPLDVVGGQVIVPMYIKITDAWGMVMKHEFNVTIKTVQE